MRLHAYQTVAVSFLREQPRAGLFLDLGLGKTAISLSALTPDHFPALVVAPKRVAERVWPRESETWRPDLSVSLALGGSTTRKEALLRRADLTVISRDNLADARPVYRTVILDELSSFKNRSSARWRAARKLCSRADYVWGLTGTPTPNGLIDLWAQMFLIDRGERLGTTLTGYRARYFVPGLRLPSGVVTSWKPRKEAEAAIHDKISDLCLYMSAEDELGSLPEVLNPIDVELPPDVRAYYRELKETLVLDLELIGEEIYTAANAAVLSNKLRQVASGFILSDEQDGSYLHLHDAKLDALREVAEGTGSGLLVFYNYKPEVDLIRQAFPEARTIDDRGALDAWDAKELPMLLAHPASAAHGLNLQYGGHSIVWVSPTWDLELYLQGNGRLARQGQRHPVIVNHLEAVDTVDKVIADRLVTKEFDQAKLLDHVRSPL